MRIISFIGQPDVIKKILQYLALWQESQAPPQAALPKPKEIIFDPFTSQLFYEGLRVGPSIWLTLDRVPSSKFKVRSEEDTSTFGEFSKYRKGERGC
jgi:hypothetical protein